MKINHEGIRTWVEVNTEALRTNYKTFRQLIGPECKLMAVAKSNAYGHGLTDYSTAMQDLGVDWIGVDSITEGLKLRKEGIFKPILILGYTLPEMLIEAAANNISVSISSPDQIASLRALKTENSKLKIHLKVDTGMHRQGFFVEGVEKALGEIKKMNNVELEGIFTHFAAAKNPAFPAETRGQIMEFKEAVKIAHELGMKPIRHAAASSGTILFPESHFDMVRIGISLMGLWPSKEVEAFAGEKIKLVPALSWKTIVAETKNLKRGDRVSYDFTETLHRESKIAILPIGYWHGFRRNLSSIGSVIIDGQYAKVLGRVTMDMVMIDVTEIKNVKSGDVVTLIGKDESAEITAEEMAYLSDTSWYETVTCINPLIKKFYI
ncbi:MAG: alanine racemase [Patescibacteria group bacterium]|jgi:alanine racemase